jgi:hypothetical protein
VPVVDIEQQCKERDVDCILCGKRHYRGGKVAAGVLRIIQLRNERAGDKAACAGTDQVPVEQDCVPVFSEKVVLWLRVHATTRQCG